MRLECQHPAILSTLDLVLSTSHMLGTGKVASLGYTRLCPTHKIQKPAPELGPCMFRDCVPPWPGARGRRPAGLLWLSAPF